MKCSYSQGLQASVPSHEVVNIQVHLISFHFIYQIITGNIQIIYSPLATNSTHRIQPTDPNYDTHILNLILLAYYYSKSMSFLHYITQRPTNHLHNRAIREVSKSGVTQELNLDRSARKEEARELIANIKRRCNKLKSSPIQCYEATESQRYNKTTQYSKNNKNRHHTTRSNYLQTKNNCYQVTQIKTNCDPVEYKRSNPDSFSSYLLKNKLSMNSSRSRTKGKLKFFDLDEIAQKLASPIKLQSKLQSEEEKLKNKRNKLMNLKNIQGFLQDIEKDKARYHEAVGNKANLFCLDSCLDLKNRRSNIRARSLWRQKVESYRDGNQWIVPWQQNEEEGSPLIKRGQSKSGLLFQQDLHEFPFPSFNRV